MVIVIQIQKENAMKASTKDRVKGNFRQLEGKIKEFPVKLAIIQSLQPMVPAKG
jgi:hypothetical protein